MRRHAKAATSGTLAIAAMTVFALLAVLAPASASAVEGAVYSGTSFGPDGTSGTSFSGLRSIAVDQVTEDVYVYDAGAEKIYKFDAEGNPANFSALGTNVIEGVGGAAGGSEYQIAVAPAGAPGGTAGDIYVANNGSTLQTFAPSGAPLAPFEPGGEICGVAVNPAGHLFVGVYPDVIEYTPGTNPPTAADETAASTAGGLNTCNVGADGLGNVYAASYLGAINKLEGIADSTPTEVDPLASTLAVDPVTNDLYVNRGSGVVKYNASGGQLASFGESGPGAISESRGIAVNATSGHAASGDIYVNSGEPGNQVEIFESVVLPDVTTEAADEIEGTTATLHGTVNPSGVAVTDCHFELVPDSQFEESGFEAVTTGEKHACTPSPGSGSAAVTVSAAVTGLAVGTDYHFRLLAANADGTNAGAAQSFTTLGPRVGGESAAPSATTARLNANVNPEGLPTTYHFEYGTTASYGLSTPESESIGSGVTDVAVSEAIVGLSPTTAYHWRIVATNAAGSQFGADQTFTTYFAPPAFDPCPNDGFRTGPSADLPDCRAYEQVSPVKKNGANAQGNEGALQASSSGDAFAWLLEAGIPGAQGASDFPRELSMRSAAGWSTQGLMPPVLPGTSGAGTLGWTDDMSKAVVAVPSPTNNSDTGLSMLDTATSQFRPMFAGPGGGGPAQYKLAGTSADDRFFVFEDNGQQLTPDAAAGKDNLYQWDDSSSTLSLLGRIPVAPATSCDDSNGPACITPAGGTFAGPYDWEGSNLNRGGAAQIYFTPDVVSDDGSKVFFTAAGGQLYMREDGIRTVQVSASQRTTPDPNGHKPATYMTATPDGRYVFFTSCEKLTDDSTAVSTAANTCRSISAGSPVQGQDLYRYDTTTGALQDLTDDSNAGDALRAAVQGMIGASDDGSTVYFSARGVLAAGATPGSCIATNSQGTGSQRCNVYRWHDGVTTFVAAIEPGDASAANWPGIARTSGNGSITKAGHVSSDGDALLFASKLQLTGYDNTGPTCGGTGGVAAPGPCPELYRYSASTNHIDCVSCIPTGAPTSGGATTTSIDVFASSTFFRVSPFVQPRNMSDDGSRVFFETPDKLVAGDTNGDSGCPLVANGARETPACQDVYEWEADGSGSCHSSAQNGGCLYLISTGTGSEPAFFGDASDSGNDVFFYTLQQLVPGDRDLIVDVYDARVEGGLASQHPSEAPSCGSAEQCRGAGSIASGQQGAGSAVFQGPGNPTLHRKHHKKRRHKHHRSRRHKHHARKHRNARHAGSTNGGSK